MKKVLFSALIASSLIACQTATKPAFDLNEPQPQMGDSITVKTSIPTAMIDNMKPGMSMRCGFSSRDFGIRIFCECFLFCA